MPVDINIVAQLLFIVVLFLLLGIASDIMRGFLRWMGEKTTNFMAGCFIIILVVYVSWELLKPYILSLLTHFFP